MMPNLASLNWFKLAVLAISFLFLAILYLSSIRSEEKTQNEMETNKLEQTIKENDSTLDLQKNEINDQDKQIKKLEKEVKQLKISRANQPTLVNYTPPTLSQKEILEKVYIVWWRDARFAALLSCESGYSNWAQGYDGTPYYQYNWGLFQISDGHSYTRTQLANPDFNIKVGKQIYDKQGWEAWPSCAVQAGFI